MRRFVGALAMLCVVGLSGCGGYSIQGRVVEGDFSIMSFVPADDPRLAEPGLANVRVEVYRDPEKPNIQLAGSQVSDGTGHFDLPLSGFGAGWLVEQWRIEARRGGFQDADTMVALPDSGRNLRLLIIMAPGASNASPREDLMEEYRRYR